MLDYNVICYGTNGSVLWFGSASLVRAARDVKPENIMYISRAVTSGIKLTDFGLAMLHSGASVTRRDDNLVGTPG